MLSTNQIKQLHTDLAQFAPISGVEEQVGGNFEISFLEEATDQQRSDAIQFLALWNPTSDPQWRDFLDGLAAIDGVYAAIATSSMASIITTRMSHLANGEDTWKGDSDQLLVAWNAAPPNLDAAQRDALNGLASNCFVPIQINDQNQIAAT